MNCLVFSLVIIGYVCAAFGQEKCTTPTGIEARCIPLKDCGELKPLVRQSRERVQYLRKWHCGYDGKEPRVCCPPVTSSQKLCVIEDGNITACVALKSCPILPTEQNLEDFLRTRCESTTGRCCEQDKDAMDDRVLSGSGQPSNKEPAPTAVQPTCTSMLTLPDPKSECCGLDTVPRNKIFGGEETLIGAYPWLAIIGYNHVIWPCGGSLINGKYVLTAAHCIMQNNTKGMSVILGEHNTTNPGRDCALVDDGSQDCTDGHISISVESFIIHPEYNRTNLVNDIALLRLTEMAPYTNFIRPICLPVEDITANPPSQLMLFAAGWGAVNEKISRNDVKLHVDLPLFNHADCRKIIPRFNNAIDVSEKQICAGGVKGKDSCKGDSGGPLSYTTGGYHELVGVASFGLRMCGTVGVPGVYTKVYEYMSWIRSNIQP